MIDVGLVKEEILLLTYLKQSNLCKLLNYLRIRSLGKLEL